MLQDEHRLSIFPAFFKVKDRHILVVGSGAEALAKIRLIAETSALIVAVAPDPEPLLYAYLKKITQSGGFVKWLDVPFDRAMLDGAVLVFAATGDFAQDCAVAAAADQVHIPVNVVDRPELCDFFTPALVNRVPIVVAIGSEGTGPVLVQLIRSRIEALLCPGIGRLARFAGHFRKLVGTYIAEGSARRKFWREFFSGTVAGAIFRGDETAARKNALELLAANQSISHRIHFLYVGHGVVDWLTLGGQRALMEADAIIHDGDVVGDILGLARRDTDFLPVSSSPSAAVQLAERLCRKGGQVLRLVTDEARLAEETRLLGIHGVDFEIIPFLSIGEVALRDSAHLPSCAAIICDSVAQGQDKLPG